MRTPVVALAALGLLGAPPRAAAAQPAPAPGAAAQPALGTRGVPVLAQDGLRFKDLNRNGRLDPYEDWRLAPDARARDLVARMTLEEKAGTMMHGTARSAGPLGAVGVGGAYDTAEVRRLVDAGHVTSLITRLGGGPAALAAQNNLLQAAAEGGRLGVPVTVSTDPRHHFQYVLGATAEAGGFAQFPEPLGLAAASGGGAGDPALVRRFGDLARREYRAVGLHMALSPQADLATEPRWSRATGTFGDDPARAERLVRAYVEGFQHGARGVDAAGVATVVKHWVGYGASREGFDGHNAYGRFADLGGPDAAAQLAAHVRPFLGAFAAGVAGVMPTYPILRGAAVGGRRLEPVGAGFSRQLVTELLRGRYGYQGLVLTDWGITNDCSARCRDGAPPGERPAPADIAMPWGVEALPERARFVKAVRAGVDQFGGAERTDLLAAAVRAGELPEARLDTSAARVLALKFALGLFEDPYVDAAAAAGRVGTDSARAAALDAQRRSLVLLENRGALLPLRAPAGRRLRVYLQGVAPAAAERLGWAVVADPRQADAAVVRLEAPFETLHPGYFFGSRQHEGRLDFRDADSAYAAFRRVSALAPTVATVYLDRPAVLTPVRDRARALVANFGVSDEALLDVLAGRAPFAGRLPFELPSSMAAVRAQRPGVPQDSPRPLYRTGYGRAR